MGYPIGEILVKETLWELDNKSADLYAATGTLVIASVPANCYVKSVTAAVLTAVTGATAEIVGDGTNDDGYLEDGFAASTGLFPKNVNDTATEFVGAFMRDSNAGGTDAADVSVTPAYKHYTSADTIDFKISGTATAGKIRFLVEFVRVA